MESAEDGAGDRLIVWIFARGDKRGRYETALARQAWAGANRYWGQAASTECVWWRPHLLSVADTAERG